MRRRVASLLLALAPALVGAQTSPVQPQPGLHNFMEVEVRLKGAPTATNPLPTLRLEKLTGWTPTVEARYFNGSIACWRTASACPPVVAATARVYLKLPWITTRVNVTRFVLCDASECLLPPFPSMVAKPGQFFNFIYDRKDAVWKEPPRVTAAPIPVPPPIPCPPPV